MPNISVRSPDFDWIIWKPSFCFHRVDLLVRAELMVPSVMAGCPEAAKQNCYTMCSFYSRWKKTTEGMFSGTYEMSLCVFVSSLFLIVKSWTLTSTEACSSSDVVLLGPPAWFHVLLEQFEKTALEGWPSSMYGAFTVVQWSLKASDGCGTLPTLLQSASASIYLISLFSRSDSNQMGGVITSSCRACQVGTVFFP